MIDNIQWFATLATVIAASITAANLGSRITGYGFCIFLLGSIAWLTAGILSGEEALAWTNALLTVLNIFGIWRWLGREAKVEEGAQNAARKSVSEPGENLFPASRLTQLKVSAGGDPVGRCVDAMIGSESGRLHYVMVSDGGVAGVGEALRRLDWEQAKVEGDELTVTMSAAQFRCTEELPRDRWPAR